MRRSTKHSRFVFLAEFVPSDPLTEFARWWMQTKPIAPPPDMYMQAGCSTGIVLYRQAPWQVQLFICNPNGEVVDHTHPCVDSYEVYIGGDIHFRHRGEIVPSETLSIRVLPTDSHGASIGPRGGSFLSIQEWKNGKEPSSVHLDWDGEPLDPAHAKALAS